MQAKLSLHAIKCARVGTTVPRKLRTSAHRHYACTIKVIDDFYRKEFYQREGTTDTPVPPPSFVQARRRGEGDGGGSLEVSVSHRLLMDLLVAAEAAKVFLPEHPSTAPIAPIAEHAVGIPPQKRLFRRPHLPRDIEGLILLKLLQTASLRDVAAVFPSVCRSWRATFASEKVSERVAESRFPGVGRAPYRRWLCEAARTECGDCGSCDPQSTYHAPTARVMASLGGGIRLCPACGAKPDNRTISLSSCKVSIAFH